MRPAYITHTRSHTSATTPRSWLISTSAIPGLAPDLPQQIEDLRLDRHVERGGGFVGDQQFRLAGQRHGDHHALVLTAGHLVRVGVEPARRVGDAHLREQPRRLGARGAAVQAPVQAERFGHLPTDALHRVQRARRVLADHGNPLAPHRRQYPVVRLQKVEIADHHPARYLRCPWQQAQRGEPGDGFAAAAFAHQADRLARGDVEVDGVQGRRAVECDAQALDADQRGQAAQLGARKSIVKLGAVFHLMRFGKPVNTAF